MPENIYITGFMGCGKSTIGKGIAEKLKRTFVDVDEVLTARLGCSIKDFFEKSGEDAFRQEETLALKELAARDMLVVSTGGGIIENKINRNVMESSGTVLYLEASLNECKKRIGEEGIKHRPKWQNLDALHELYLRRVKYYNEADIKVLTDNHSITSIIELAINKLYPEDKFSVRMEGVDCPVVCSFSPLFAVSSAIEGRKIAIVTDKNVADLYIPEYQKFLPNALVIVLEPGEDIKNLAVAEKIYKRLLDNHFNRDDYLLALGGGTVTDLGAFVAATYKRGMHFMLVSTTLLGCVDAAVGGKAAVNLGSAKNIVGAFTIPDLVVLDAGAFATLGREALSDGLVEAYKTGLIYNTRIAALIENHYNGLLEGDLPLLKSVAALSAKTKAKVVSNDFRESGLRAILNFGHTYGHAVEGFYNYSISHGKSVALGMIVSLYISMLRGMLDPDRTKIMCDTVRAIAGALPDFPDHDEAMEIMSHDKKIRSGKLIFVLLKARGETVIVDDVSNAEILTAVNRIKEDSK